MDQRIAMLADNTSGRVESYLDLKTFENLSRDEFLKRVRGGVYPEYRLESRGGIEYPVQIDEADRRQTMG